LQRLIRKENRLTKDTRRAGGFTKTYVPEEGMYILITGEQLIVVSEP
jgi:hypothetical protein